MSFKAFVIEKGETGQPQRAGWREMAESELMEGDVTVRVRHSTMNYKDALAVTGKSPVVRRFPMVPGIDFAGEVIASDAPDYAVGDEVILNGWGVGETHLGGFAEKARVRAEWLLHRPAALSGAQCMTIGTAGYTAALSVLRLQSLGVMPADGPILVTGASGGVGSFAVTLLATLGFDVHASTGKLDEKDYLKGLGAVDVLDRAEFSEHGRPLGKERFAGAVDSVGGQSLASVLSQIKYGGAVAACGLAQGHELPATVMPFILRNVTLAGVDSVMTNQALRRAAWDLLAARIDPRQLERITNTFGRDEVEPTARALLAGEVRGRMMIHID